MDKLLKLSFPTKEDWEEVKQTLQADDGYVDGIIDVFELGRLQKPPAEDWIPDPENPDDNGWGLYEDLAVDVVANAGFDYSGLKDFLAKKQGSYGHVVIGGSFDIIVAGPDSSWTKAELQSYLSDKNISYTNSMTKAQLLELTQ